MAQAEKATRLANLHQKGRPLVLNNIWDAGGAKAVEEAGATAVATGSSCMAAAHGYDDGEAIPLDFVLRIVERICASVDLPVTVDCGGGNATDPHEVVENVRKLIRAGAVGINFDDRALKDEKLYSISAQTARICAIKAVAADEGIPLVLNARTDLFLGTAPDSHESHLAEAFEREAAYAEAGADCFFVPGLTDAQLISELTENASLPIHVMIAGDLKSIKDVVSLGVSRTSYGPGLYREFLSNLKGAFTSIKWKASGRKTIVPLDVV